MHKLGSKQLCRNWIEKKKYEDLQKEKLKFSDEMDRDGLISIWLIQNDYDSGILQKLCFCVVLIE